MSEPAKNPFEPFFDEFRRIVREVVHEEIEAALNGNGHSANAESDLLRIKAAAGMLGHSEIWLYRNSKRLPFSVKMGRSIRFSRKGIEKWIETQKRV